MYSMSKCTTNSAWVTDCSRGRSIKFLISDSSLSSLSRGRSRILKVVVHPKQLTVLALSSMMIWACPDIQLIQQFHYFSKWVWLMQKKNSWLLVHWAADNIKVHYANCKVQVVTSLAAVEVQNADKECAELSWRCAELSRRWVVNISKGVVHVNQKKHRWIRHCWGTIAKCLWLHHTSHQLLKLSLWVSPAKI